MPHRRATGASPYFGLQDRYYHIYTGRTMAQQSVQKSSKDGVITFNTTLQLNTDKMALDMQRVHN